MSIFRSEEMGLYMLSIEKNGAMEVMENLGRLSCLHFIDMNGNEQSYSRTYSSLVRRCDEALRRVAYIESLCEKHKSKLRPPRNVNDFLRDIDQLISNTGKDTMAYFEGVEQTLTRAEQFLVEQEKRAEMAQERSQGIAQHKYVLDKGSEIVLARAK
jgi:hypothetical protein